MTAIAVNKREDLPDAIRSIIEAVKFGELDIQIEDVAEKGTAELRLKGPLKVTLPPSFIHSEVRSGGLICPGGRL